MQTISRRAGFTLVELAIVLTIIGLIVGGVIVGADMIKSAQLNSFAADSKKYIAAINAFRDKYQYLPGDMPNATQFWGAADGSTGNTAACLTVNSLTLANPTNTCNGDGNGQINDTSTGGNSYELSRAWQQLANAALIEGQYCGSIGTNCGYAQGRVGGVTAPKSRLDGTSWYTDWQGYIAASAVVFGGNYGHWLVPYSDQGVPPRNLTPAQAYELDGKFDDGLPGISGNIMGWKGNSAYHCTTNANNISDVGAQYNTSDTNPDCYIAWVRAY